MQFVVQSLNYFKRENIKSASLESGITDNVFVIVEVRARASNHSFVIEDRPFVIPSFIQEICVHY